MADDPDDGAQRGGARHGRTPKLRIEDDTPDDAIDADEDDLDDDGRCRRRARRWPI